MKAKLFKQLRSFLYRRLKKLSNKSLLFKKNRYDRVIYSFFCHEKIEVILKWLFDKFFLFVYRFSRLLLRLRLNIDSVCLQSE